MGWKMRWRSCGRFWWCRMFPVPVLLEGWYGAWSWHFGNGWEKQSVRLSSLSREKRGTFRLQAACLCLLKKLGYYSSAVPRQVFHVVVLLIVNEDRNFFFPYYQGLWDPFIIFFSPLVLPSESNCWSVCLVFSLSACRLSMWIFARLFVIYWNSRKNISLLFGNTVVPSKWSEAELWLNNAFCKVLWDQRKIKIREVWRTQGARGGLGNVLCLWLGSLSAVCPGSSDGGTDRTLRIVSLLRRHGSRGTAPGFPCPGPAECLEGNGCLVNLPMPRRVWQRRGEI